MRSRRALTAVLAAGAVLMTGSPAAAPATPRWYVSLGDSYASGYEATGTRSGRNTRNGFAYQVPAAAQRRGHDLRLVNFACAGATTTTILTRKGCSVKRRGVGGRRYRSTQVAAVERFLRTHRARVALISVSIGGNDVGRCASVVAPVDCLQTEVASIRKHVTALARRLRKAAGPRPRITGITYPDVLLERWLRNNAGKLVASLSIAAFRDAINPALKEAYAAGKGRFVDITAATGAYGRFDDLVDTRRYGRIPRPVARVCELTWVCRYGDIHANRAGYRLIANLVARTLR